MKNRLNYILISLLWLLLVTLGASFWFNIRYGFNIFVAQHWQYLAYMQASDRPVATSFYVSIVVVLAIAVLGLYILLQPHRRKIVLPVVDNTNNQKQTVPVVQTPIQVAPVAEQPIVKEEAVTPTPQVATTPTASGLIRPPRLNIPTATITRAPAPRVPLSSTTPAAKIDPETEYADIHEIFTSAGFVYKGSPRIKNMQTSVIAIGTDEVLWLGATGVKTSDMKVAIDTMRGVFMDTLEDIEINMNAFIIGAPDASENSEPSILQFATVDELRTYIMAHPNTLSDDDAENFDAYSAYIGTVIDYIGKI